MPRRSPTECGLKVNCTEQVRRVVPDVQVPFVAAKSGEGAWPSLTVTDPNSVAGPT